MIKYIIGPSSKEILDTYIKLKTLLMKSSANVLAYFNFNGYINFGNWQFNLLPSPPANKIKAVFFYLIILIPISYDFFFSNSFISSNFYTSFIPNGLKF